VRNHTCSTTESIASGRSLRQISRLVLRDVHPAATQRQFFRRIVEDPRHRSVGVLDHEDPRAVERQIADELLEHDRVRGSALPRFHQFDARVALLQIGGGLDVRQVRPNARFVRKAQAAHPQAACECQSCHSQCHHS
jgi:hypothetical protein